MADGKTSAPAIDEPTGQATTGHEWDGIRELDRPLPRWWLITFYATIVWALGYAILYPAVPLVRGATAGLLGYSSRAELDGAVAAARTAQASYLGRIADLPIAEIRKDPELVRFAVAGGRSAFLVNCVQCHGAGAAGGKGYANLNDDDWLWGGTVEAIHQTIAFGVRSGHAEARFSEMPAFGEGILDRRQIAAITEYVLSLSGRAHQAEPAAAGKPLFTENCAACHGPAGAGDQKVGAPALNDAIALYGADRATIAAQIARPRHGVMPGWEGRLDPATVKQLALYVFSLGGGQRTTP